MAQLSSTKVVDPYGEVNVWPQPDGSVRVKATILMTPSVEGAQTGIAIDGSRSMQLAFGVGGAAVSSLFGAAPTPNVVEPVVRTLATYLGNFDSDGKTTVIYWACGTAGQQVEELGDMDAAEIKQRSFPPPKQFGTGTKLLPAVKYFADTKFPTCPWSLLVFITDGEIEDLSEVKTYSLELAKEIAVGKRGFLKLVLIGVGQEVNETQMEELDDLDYGGLTDRTGQVIDLWDHKLAAEMKRVEEIFAEVVSSDVVLAPSAEILDDNGGPVVPIGRSSYKDGLPALIEFSMPTSSKAFHLVLPDGKRVAQSIV